MGMQRKAGAKKSATKEPAPKRPAPSTKPLWQKLFVKGGTVLVLNAPPGFEKRFAGSPAKVTTRCGGTAETVVLFARDAAHLETAMPQAIGALSPSATFWIAYRKGDKTFHRDVIAKQVIAHGYTGIAMIAIDDELSALRIKPI